MPCSFPGETYVFAFFDGSECFLVQGGDKGQVPLLAQKLRAFISLEMSKISVREAICDLKYA